MRNAGQATIEYLMVFVLIGLISIRMAKGFSSFFADSMGSLAHVLSIHLTTGICKNDCFFNGYKNGEEN